MKRAGKLFSAIAAALLFATADSPGQDACLTCHTAAGDTPSTLFRHDVHFRKGITCAGCHGGNAASDDMDVAMSRKAGFLGVPKGDEISRRCVACHADADRMKRFNSTLPTNQWENLQASVHGRLSLSGKEHIVQCTTCHNAHGIVSVKNPSSPVHPLNVVKTCASCHSKASYMRSYNPSLPVDQKEKYLTSVHGMRNAAGDAKVAECASCHGSHDIRPAKDVKSHVYAENVPATCSKCHSDARYMRGYRIPTDQFEKYSRSVHGVALLQKHDRGAPACNSCHGNHGAAPPGLESISKVCGTCHALNADLFASSPHKKAFDDRRLPECETCHGNHEILPATDTMLGTASDATCVRCHSTKENPAGFTAAAEMRSLVDSLKAEESHATMLVDEAEQKGMEVGEPKFRLRDVHQARMQARTMVHAFDAKKLQQTVISGLKASSSISEEAGEAIHEYYFRRIGLGISTIILTLLGISLLLFVRRLERRQK